MSNAPLFTPQPPKEYKTTMDYKGRQIEKAQRSTQESIRVSGSATDATLVLTTFYKNEGWQPINKKEEEKMEDFLKEKWEMWRKYFFEQRDIDETYKSLTDPLK